MIVLLGWRETLGDFSRQFQKAVELRAPGMPNLRQADFSSVPNRLPMPSSPPLLKKPLLLALRVAPPNLVALLVDSESISNCYVRDDEEANKTERLSNNQWERRIHKESIIAIHGDEMFTKGDVCVKWMLHECVHTCVMCT